MVTLEALVLLKQLNELGRAIDEAWRAAGHRDEELASIAESELHRRVVEVSTEELISELMMSDELPLQTLDRGDSFGEPPFSVYESDDLVVQILFWFDGSVVIHEHAFTGAFQVLAGGSLHTTFSFEEEHIYSPRLKVGRLCQLAVERLTRGDVRPILPQGGTLHRLFHVEHPSISLVVRSRGLTALRPQLTALAPGLAIDTFHRPPITMRRRMLALRLLDAGAPHGLEGVLKEIERTDVWAATSLVLRLGSRPGEERRAAIDRLTSVHGGRLSIAEEVMSRARVIGNLAARRAKVRQLDQRYLLALLLNAPDRASYLKLAASQAADPIEWTVTTLRALSQQALATGDDESGLGVDMDDTTLYALGALLSGQTEAELVSGAPNDLQPAAIQKACFVLPHITALKPLFR